MGAKCVKQEDNAKVLASSFPESSSEASAADVPRNNQTIIPTLSAPHTPPAATPGGNDKPRRYLFVSLNQLCTSYDEIPSEVLDSALFFFAAKRSWVLPTTEDEYRESQKTFVAKACQPDTNLRNIVSKKDEQGHVFWLEPGSNYDALSAQLTRIVDPVTGRRYKPLQLDPSWWMSNITFADSSFFVDGRTVANEIECRNGKFKPVMELFYQSNPTIFPMKAWRQTPRPVPNKIRLPQPTDKPAITNCTGIAC